MKKFSLIIFVFLIFCCPVFANLYDNLVNISSISVQIPQLDSLKCKFKQEKYLKNISKPIVLYGDFEFIKDRGVYFYTKYPFISTADYTNKNYKQINDVINAISFKKYSKLEKEFNFYYEGDKKQWALGMKPKKNSNTYNYISSITIEGTDYIRKIVIEQTNRNKTIIWFEK